MPKANQRRVWLGASNRRTARKSSTPTRNVRGKRSDHKQLGDRATLVWIDDYQPFLEIYKSVFECVGFNVLTASRGSIGLELANSNPVDAVVVDYEMPELSGEEVARAVKSRYPKIPVVMCSGSLQVPDRVRVLVDAVCDKAGSRDHLLSAIQGVLQNRQNFRSATPVAA